MKLKPCAQSGPLNDEYIHVVVNVAVKRDDLPMTPETARLYADAMADAAMDVLTKEPVV
jgi:propanediol dehydratase small subunit